MDIGVGLIACPAFSVMASWCFHFFNNLGFCLVWMCDDFLSVSLPFPLTFDYISHIFLSHSIHPQKNNSTTAITNLNTVPRGVGPSSDPTSTDGEDHLAVHRSNDGVKIQKSRVGCQ